MPGESLRKTEICSQLGVSRSPVSEAVTRLAAEGLVEVVPQSGTYVSRFSFEEVRAGVFLREAVELAAVEVVAQTITEEQVLMLRRNLRVQAAAVADGDVAGFYGLDNEMHRLILSFTGFRRLSQLAETGWPQVNRARQMILPNTIRVSDTLEEHRRIVDALAAHDPETARAEVRFHLRRLCPYLEELEAREPELFQRTQAR